LSINKLKIAVVIPCYRVRSRIASVINKIDFSLINQLYIVDDCCPQNTGNFVLNNFKNKKITVIILTKNLGVGGATMKGFEKSLKDKNIIIIKIDGDGQHDPRDISRFLQPLISGKYDFCKGTRFLTSRNFFKIPKIRLFGNLALTFFTRISSGYWHITDCLNGYFSIDSNLLKKLNLKKIKNNYFFEQDLLFNISLYKARIKEISIKTKYYNKEKGNLNAFLVIPSFVLYHLQNFSKKFLFG